MSNTNVKMEERLIKLREERQAREQARILKLRDLNLKRYPKSESQANLATNQPSTSKIANTNNLPQNKNGAVTKNVHHSNGVKSLKNNFHVNGTTKRPITAPPPNKVGYQNVKSKVESNIDSKDKVDVTSNRDTTAKISESNTSKTIKSTAKNSTVEIDRKPSTSNVTSNNKTLNGDIKTQNKDDKNQTKPDNAIENKVLTDITKRQIVVPKIFKSDPKLRKSFAPSSNSVFQKPKSNMARKSMLPKLIETKSESVFERLYKPKYITKKPDEAEKSQTEPNKKITRKPAIVQSKRHTVFDKKTMEHNIPPRRSISAVHFKRISKSEANNCIHKWSSIGDKLNNRREDMNEDESVKEDRYVSAIKSERKKVQFMTPIMSNFNTPRPEELQARLKSWLQKRGKSLDSYHHLQCFGIHNLRPDLGAANFVQFEDALQTPTKVAFDEENKENIALDSDSDDGSYADTMTEPADLSSGDKIDVVNWRNASINSESIGLNDTPNFNETTLTSGDTLSNVNEVLLGALNDLDALIREGFDWQQAARWLRMIRGRFPSAPRTAAYWECRAALENARGDLPASVQCWEQAIAKGTEHSVVESNLDQLLDKFMQLKISPQSGGRQPNPKLVDVKNVFKSSIIRFAVQQAKLRSQSEQTPVFTVTPVRRSARLSRRLSRTPLRLCDTMRQVEKVAPQHVFTPNDNFVQTP